LHRQLDLTIRRAAQCRIDGLYSPFDVETHPCCARAEGHRVHVEIGATGRQLIARRDVFQVGPQFRLLVIRDQTDGDRAGRPPPEVVPEVEPVVVRAGQLRLDFGTHAFAVGAKADLGGLEQNRAALVIQFDGLVVHALPGRGRLGQLEARDGDASYSDV